jgi:hypothetical protein
MRHTAKKIVTGRLYAKKDQFLTKKILPKESSDKVEDKISQSSPGNKNAPAKTGYFFMLFAYWRPLRSSRWRRSVSGRRAAWQRFGTCAG